MVYKIKLTSKVEEKFALLHHNYPALGSKLVELMEAPLNQKTLLGNGYYINAGNRYCFVYNVKGNIVTVTDLIYRAYLHKILIGKIQA
jgi:hypothetical protein